MTGIYEILKQDFAAAKEAFDVSDFHALNIYSNRLMSNVVFGDDDDKQYIVPGYFLRIIATEFLAIRDEKVATAALQPAGQFIAILERGFTTELDLTTIWGGFFDYSETRRKLFLTPAEGKIYKPNPSFTARGLQFLTKLFFNDPFLSRKNSIMLRALLTESDRLIRNHGAERKELVLYSLLRALDWIDRYLIVALNDAEKSASTDSVKGEILQFVERMQNWYSGSEDLPYRDATNLLCDLLVCWRNYYFRYMDRIKPASDEDRRVELPGQVRQRIGDTIAQALQRDIGEKGQKPKKGNR